MQERTLVGVGASTMAGVGDSRGGFFDRLKGDERILKNYASFLNLGVGGWMVPHMLARAQRVDYGPAHDTVVLLGCNDMPRRNDANPAGRTKLADYGACLHDLFALVKGERSLFVTSFAVSEQKTGIDPKTFEVYMDLATEKATVNGYELWDLFRETRERAATMWAADGLHFADAGHEYIARGVAERMAGVA